MKDFDENDQIDGLLREIAREQGRPASIVENRIQIVERAFAQAKRIFKQRGTKVSYEINKPFTSMGYVSIVSKEVTIKDIDKALDLFKTANNVEIYPKTDGTVQINLTYHGLTKNLRR